MNRFKIYTVTSLLLLSSLTSTASGEAIAGFCRTGADGISIISDGTVDLQTAPLLRQIGTGPWEEVRNIDGPIEDLDRSVSLPSSRMHRYQAGSSNVLEFRPNAMACAQSEPAILTGICYLAPSDNPKRVVLNWTKPVNQKTNSLIKNINGASGFFISDCCDFGPMKPDGFHQFSYTDYNVSPGNIYTYRHKSDAPSSSESVVFQCPPSTPLPPVDDAQYVSQNLPATVTPGQTFLATVTLRNTGTTIWTAAANYRLGNQYNPGIWGVDRAFLSSGAYILPGQTRAFSWTATAPTTPGTYNFQWRMIKEGTGWFGQSSPLTPIVVIQPNSLPTGIFTGATCTLATGNASDLNAPAGVRVRIRTAPGGPLVGQGLATPNFSIPLSLPPSLTGLPTTYQLYAYAVDEPTGTQYALAQNPRTVICNPPPPQVSSVSVTTPDYCLSDLVATINWSSNAAPQQRYQILITTSSSPGAGTILADSSILNGPITTFQISLGQNYGRTLWAHVRVWDNYNPGPSSWAVSPAFNTSAGPYPRPNFPANPPKLVVNQDTVFSDTTDYRGVGSQGQLWDFGDGQTGNGQTAIHVYSNPSTYNVTLTATNSNNNSCSVTKILDSQALLPVPKYKEVRP